MKMQIEHLALWVQDMEAMKEFYLNYFDVVSGPKYTNGAKRFASYFINFGECRTRLELMTDPNIQPYEGKRGYGMGLAHFSISVGGKDKVDALTEQLRKEPRIAFKRFEGFRRYSQKRPRLTSQQRPAR
jgi:lactoylglutathione lyase